MIHYRSETRTVEVPTKITCNRCASEATFGHADCRAENYLPVEFVFGYASEHFGDSTKVKFHLCEGCVAAIVSAFEIPAEIEERQ